MNGLSGMIDMFFVAHLQARTGRVTLQMLFEEGFQALNTRKLATKQ